MNEDASMPQPVAAASDGACPFCRAPVAEDATKCAHCGSNIGDIRLCPSCAEPVRASATVCPFCRAQLDPQPQASSQFLEEPWSITASPVGAFFSEQSPTALFFPPVLTITNTEINVRRRMLMGMRTLDSKIQACYQRAEAFGFPQLIIFAAREGVELKF